MKIENQYWKEIAELLGITVTGNMKSVNHYLKLIYEELSGEEDTGRKPNQFYLQYLLDYYSEDEE